MNNKELLEKIEELKKDKDAIILAHNYQSPEIQNMADILGDSLDLSRKAANTDKSIIVFCGVIFMAESAKLLSPDKSVLIPRIDAGCAMAGMVKPEGLKEMKARYPNAKVVAYVNTSAATKALADVCCTSANAVKIVNKIDAEEIIFVPDKNLGSYVAAHTDKTVHLWDGYCYVHNQFTEEHVEIARSKHPGAALIVHPEAPAEVVKLADSVESTSGMLRFSEETDKHEIIVGTEVEMVYRLKTEFPKKKFFPLKEDAVCINMKKTGLQDVFKALNEDRYKIFIDEEIAVNAGKSLEKMLELS